MYRGRASHPDRAPPERGRFLQKAVLGKAVVFKATVAADYDVVEDRNPDYLASFIDALGDIAILRRRLRASGWMIMTENDGGGVVLYCDTGHFSGVNDGLVKKPLGYHMALYNIVPAVERHDDETLLFARPVFVEYDDHV